MIITAEAKRQCMYDFIFNKVQRGSPKKKIGVSIEERKLKLNVSYIWILHLLEWITWVKYRTFLSLEDP